MKRMFFPMKRFIALTALGLAPLLVSAEGVYGGISIGQTTVPTTTDGRLFAEAIAEITHGSVTEYTDSKQLSNWSILGGYKLNESLAVELSYGEIKTKKYSFMTDTSYGANTESNYKGFSLGIVVRPPIDTGLNRLFGVIGVHNYTAKGSGVSWSAGTFSDNGSTSVSGTGSLYGFGYDLDISKNTSLRFDVRRMNKVAGTSDANFTNLNVGLLKGF